VPCVVGAGAGDLAVAVPVAALLAAALAGVWMALARPGRTRDGRALAASALAIAAVPLLAGLNLPDADLADGAALTLAVVGPVTPLLVAAQAWVWWTFRGRVAEPSYL
jgi:cytochrome bd-type quinol oxidase subunit 2